MFVYVKEIKTSLARETAMGQSNILVLSLKFGRSSGRKACGHLCIRLLSGPRQKQTTPACVPQPQAFICSGVCAHVGEYN